MHSDIIKVQCFRNEFGLGFLRNGSHFDIKSSAPLDVLKKLKCSIVCPS